jgi:hypothetical protein
MLQSDWLICYKYFAVFVAHPSSIRTFTFFSALAPSWLNTCAFVYKHTELALINKTVHPPASCCQWFALYDRGYTAFGSGIGNERQHHFEFWWILRRYSSLYFWISSNWRKVQPPYMADHRMECYSLTRNSGNSDTISMSRMKADKLVGVMSDNARSPRQWIKHHLTGLLRILPPPEPCGITFWTRDTTWFTPQPRGSPGYQVTKYIR